MTNDEHLTNILKQTYDRTASSVDESTSYVDSLLHMRMHQLTMLSISESLLASVVFTASKMPRSLSEIANPNPMSLSPEPSLDNERLQLAKNVTVVNVVYIEPPENTEVRYLAMVGHNTTSRLLEDMVESMAINDILEK